MQEGILTVAVTAVRASWEETQVGAGPHTQAGSCQVRLFLLGRTAPALGERAEELLFLQGQLCVQKWKERGVKGMKKNSRKACITDQLYKTVGKYSKQSQVTNCGVWRQEVPSGTANQLCSFCQNNRETLKFPWKDISDRFIKQGQSSKAMERHLGNENPSEPFIVYELQNFGMCLVHDQKLSKMLL